MLLAVRVPARIHVSNPYIGYGPIRPESCESRDVRQSDTNDGSAQRDRAISDVKSESFDDDGDAESIGWSVGRPRPRLHTHVHTTRTAGARHAPLRTRTLRMFVFSATLRMFAL